MRIFHKIANWYFTKNALPYWTVLAIDCLICYLSGILVFWLYYRGPSRWATSFFCPRPS